MCFNKIVPITLLSLVPAITFAAETAPKQTGGSFNATLISLVSLACVLLLAILILGNTLLQLAHAYKDKVKEKRSSGIIKTILLAAITLSATSANAQEVVKDIQPANTAAMISDIPAKEFYALIGLIGLELLVILGLILMIRMVARVISGVPEKTIETNAVAKVNFWDRFNKVVPIEKEQDILLDHNYDGIQELDNSLPPWWKYGFYLTIVTAVVYLWYYHAGGNGPSSYDEYAAEVQAGEESKAAFLAKSANNVDENTIKMLDASGIAQGQTIFQNMCAACHAKDGGGGVGPNLTDEYWLHGGSIKDVFKSIKYGWVDKGMKSWKDDFSPNQLAQISSYVMSLKGSKPAAPKDKQGDLHKEDTAQPADTSQSKAVAMK